MSCLLEPKEARIVEVVRRSPAAARRKRPEVFGVPHRTDNGNLYAQGQPGTTAKIVVRSEDRFSRQTVTFRGEAMSASIRDWLVTRRLFAEGVESLPQGDFEGVRLTTEMDIRRDVWLSAAFHVPESLKEDIDTLPFQLNRPVGPYPKRLFFVIRFSRKRHSNPIRRVPACRAYGGIRLALAAQVRTGLGGKQLWASGLGQRRAAHRVSRLGIMARIYAESQPCRSLFLRGRQQTRVRQDQQGRGVCQPFRPGCFQRYYDRAPAGGDGGRGDFPQVTGRPLHILMTDPHLRGVGQVRYVSSLAAELTRFGHRVTIGCKPDSVLVEHAKAAGCGVDNRFTFRGDSAPLCWLADIRDAPLHPGKNRYLHVKRFAESLGRGSHKTAFWAGRVPVRTRHNTYPVHDMWPTAS